MRQTRNCLFLFLISTLLLAGCWDLERLRNRAFVTGISVDKHKAGYTVGIEQLEFGGRTGGGGGGNQHTGTPRVIVMNYPEPSIEQPLHEFEERLSGLPFYANMDVLVFGPEIVREGIRDAVSHFIRDPDMRRATPVVFSTGRAEELLKIKPGSEAYTSLYLSKLVSRRERTGHTLETDIGDISRAIHEQGAVLVPLIRPATDGNGAKIVGSSVLQSGKWVGNLGEQETQTVIFLTKNVTRGSDFATCPDGKGFVSVDIISSKPNVKPLVKNGKLVIDAEFGATAYVGEYTCSGDNIERDRSLKAVEHLLNEELQSKYQKHLAAILHRTGADVLNLQKVIKRNPSLWKQVQNDWPDLIRHSDVHVEVQVKVKEKGTST